MLEKQKLMPFKHYFRVNEYTDPYELVKDIDKILNRFGFKVERIIRTGPGHYDPPYYFKAIPTHKLKIS